MLPATLNVMEGKPMTTPTFDTIEAQASYGIGLQVGQQLSESGLEGLLPEALVAGIADALEGKQPLFRLMLCTARCVKSTNVLTPCVARVSKRWLRRREIPGRKPRA
jgi:hypothetical protein